MIRTARPIVAGVSLSVALLSPSLVEAVGLQTLAQHEEMLGPIVAYQGGFHLCKGALVHSMVAQFGELAGIALTRQNRVNNAQAAHPGNVADDVVKVQVHLLQGLLHVLNFGLSRPDQIEPMALQASQPADGVLGPERSAQ